MSPFRKSLLLVIFTVGFPVVKSNHDDKIVSLPGVAQMPEFDSFSGFLRVTGQKQLHYWLVKCEDEQSSNLIIWFNGGPGCSSMEGLFTENGPYKFTSQGDLYRNPYSWNKLAHVLYIESPAGVGFSRAPLDAAVDDDTTAADVTKALLDFFTKFPELERTDIYVAGESYAGVYIPVLVNYIEVNAWHLMRRIKGVMIGNPLLVEDINQNSLIYFAYYHGITGTIQWNKILKHCCKKDLLNNRCNFQLVHTENCVAQVWGFLHSIYSDGLNLYNLYADCATTENVASMQIYKNMMQRRLIHTVKDKYFGKGKHKLLRSLNEKVLRMTPTCSNSSVLTNYLNRPDVQEAIHVDNINWELCSRRINENYNKQYPDVRKLLKTILEPQKDVRMMLYFGDMDMACNHLGGEWIADSLNIPNTFSRRSWSIEKQGFDQIAGFVKIYDKLTYVTVKGAGHMVPTDKPQAAYEMTERFLNDEPL